MLVCLNSFVMNVVSLPMYVNVDHFRFASSFSSCDGGRGRVSGGVSERSCCVLCWG